MAKYGNIKYGQTTYGSGNTIILSENFIFSDSIVTNLITGIIYLQEQFTFQQWTLMLRFEQFVLYINEWFYFFEKDLFTIFRHYPLEVFRFVDNNFRKVIKTIKQNFKFRDALWRLLTIQLIDNFKMNDMVVKFAYVLKEVFRFTESMTWKFLIFLKESFKFTHTIIRWLNGMRRGIWEKIKRNINF